MPAIVANHAFWLPGRTRRVKDVERVRRGNRNTVRRLPGRLRRFDFLRPVEVTTFDHRGGFLLPLQDQAALRLVPGDLDRFVQQRLVGNDPRRLDAAGCRQHHFRLRIVNPRRQFRRREPAKHHRMDRADPRARQHRHRGFRNHRHVDDHPVTLADTPGRNHARKRRHFVLQFAVRVRLLFSADRAIVNERFLIAPFRHMAVDAVVTGVAGRPREPASVLSAVGIENLVPRRHPIDLARRFGPECFRCRLPSSCRRPDSGSCDPCLSRSVLPCGLVPVLR